MKTTDNTPSSAVEKDGYRELCKNKIASYCWWGLVNSLNIFAIGNVTLSLLNHFLFLTRDYAVIYPREETDWQT